MLLISAQFDPQSSVAPKYHSYIQKTPVAMENKTNLYTQLELNIANQFEGSGKIVLLLQHNNKNPITPKSKSTKTSSIQSRTPTVGVRKSPRLNNKVQSLRRSSRFSNKKSPPKKIDSGDGKTEVDSGVVEDGGKGKRKCSGDEIVERLRKEEVEGGVNGKRKRGGEIAQGWTIEQELALHTAYFTAKLSPHFWKNVSKRCLSFCNKSLTKGLF
ncbi:uncharacterized protein [Cicer arietinum]|uniref:uncharacterized protein n=1 Tax=Cicer arietinum TaxID=3827 RepID=UPI003CC5D28E